MSSSNIGGAVKNMSQLRGKVHNMSADCSCWPGEPGVRPVKIELTDFKTKEVVDTLEVDACLVATGRAPYTQVPFFNSEKGCWLEG